VNNEISEQFDALVSGLEAEFATARAAHNRRRTRRFVSRFVLGSLAVAALGVQQPLLGAIAFVLLLGALNRALR
jgi:hypothetical protein